METFHGNISSGRLGQILLLTNAAVKNIFLCPYIEVKWSRNNYKINLFVLENRMLPSLDLLTDFIALCNFF